MYSATVILLVACSPLLIQARISRLRGGLKEAQLSDERQNELAKYALDAFQSQSNSAFQYQLVHINKITSQVVNGVLYKVELEIGETDCRIGDVNKECKLKTSDGSTNKSCRFEIHKQPWVNHRSVRIVSCTGKQA